MNGSTASASAEGAPARNLIVSPNWIGDAIMAMPAVAVLRRLYPDRHLAVLARGSLAEVWRLHPAPDQVIRYDGRPGLVHPLYRELHAQHFTTAWVLPNSFRSAWMMFRAGIPSRIGASGGYRRPLLTACRPYRDATRPHQAWEALHLLAPDVKLDHLPPTGLSLPEDVIAATAVKFPAPAAPEIGLIPGAARGPAKRWPPRHYAALARSLVREGYVIALFGGPDDRALGDELAAEIGPAATNYAGRTSIAEWAALLRRCRLVVANDSGGMHLAAALDRPLIALYGLTDPARTGPLGSSHVILQNSARKSRDIARHSAEAQKSLASIRPETVYQSVMTLLG